ncbi:MAG TPA: P-II family nitrogen regulator [Nitrospirota bacterium]
MKMFVLVYASTYDDYVISAISEGGIKAYTKWTEVHGTGPETGPKLRYSQGDNDVLTMVVNDEDAAKLRKVVQQLRKDHPLGGVRCFIVPVEEMI